MDGDEAIERVATRPVVLVDSRSTLRQAAERLTDESSIGAAIVRGYHPPASISERDIVRALAEGARPHTYHVDST